MGNLQSHLPGSQFCVAQGWDRSWGDKGSYQGRVMDGWRDGEGGEVSIFTGEQHLPLPGRFVIVASPMV